jgi:hypothetical protein
MKIIVVLFVVVLNINLYAMVDSLKECTDLIHVKSEKSLQCFQKKKDNVDAKIFQAYIYFFDFVKIKNKNAVVKKLITESTEAERTEKYSNWNYLGYSVDDMLKDEEGFLSGMNILGVDLSVKFIEKHGEVLINAYRAKFGSNRDNFIGRIVFDNKEFNIPALNKFFSLLEEIDGLSGSSSCQGTMIYGKYINRASNKLMTLFSIQKEYYRNKENYYRDHDNVVSYLKYWAVEDLWSFKKYHEIYAQKEIAQRELAQHYQNFFKINNKNAVIAADVALNNYISSRMIISYNDIKESFNKVFTSLWKKDSEDEVLKLIQDEDSKVTLNCIKIAIINNYSTSLISKMIETNLRDEIEEINQYANTVDDILFVSVNNTEILKFLLKDKHLNPNTKNSFGKTPVFRAIQDNNIQSVELLLKYNADINAKTDDEKDYNCDMLSAYKRTPMMYAAWQGNLEMIKFIIKNGGNTQDTDSNNEKSIHYIDKNEILSEAEKVEARKLL